MGWRQNLLACLKVCIAWKWAPFLTKKSWFAFFFFANSRHVSFAVPALYIVIILNIYIYLHDLNLNWTISSFSVLSVPPFQSPSIIHYGWCSTWSINTINNKIVHSRGEEIFEEKGFIHSYYSPGIIFIYDHHLMGMKQSVPLKGFFGGTLPLLPSAATVCVMRE